MQKSSSAPGSIFPTSSRRKGSLDSANASEKLSMRLRNSRASVIATGGGAVLLPENREYLSTRGTVVYLQTGIAQQLERTRNGRQRPLLYTDDPEAKLRELMNFRMPLYESLADITVTTDGRQVRAVTEEIVERLKEAAPFGSVHL